MSGSRRGRPPKLRVVSSGGSWGDDVDTAQEPISDEEADDSDIDPVDEDGDEDGEVEGNTSADEEEVLLDKDGQPIESLPDIDKRIKHTFSVLDKVAKGVIEGHIRAAIVSGAAGCGKTYTLETAFTRAMSAGKINFDSVKGAMSAIGLYKRLFECKDEGQLLELDDTDGIYADIDALNILKAALDTSKIRKVHWNKESKILAEEGIPRDFEFNGAVVFITNTDFVREMERQSKMSVHYSALMSRCMYVDLGIHSKKEIFVRIYQVVYSEEFLRMNGLKRSDVKAMLDWLHKNLEKVRFLSIRTILQLVSLIKTDGDWVDMAEVLMLNPRRYGNRRW